MYFFTYKARKMGVFRVYNLPFRVLFRPSENSLLLKSQHMGYTVYSDTKNRFFTEIIMSTENIENNNTDKAEENVLEAFGIRPDMTLGEIMQTKPLSRSHDGDS